MWKTKKNNWGWLRKASLPNQREKLRDLLLMASSCDTWLTLEELAEMTKYPQASISAQLRHLRKQEHGGYVVEKRLREWEECRKATKRERVWEYQMRSGVWVVDGKEGTPPERSEGCTMEETVVPEVATEEAGVVAGEGV